MSITSTSVSTSLKQIEMSELKNVVVKELQKHDLRVSIENIDAVESSLLVKKLGNATLLTLRRDNHRPLEVEVEVDYGQVSQLNQVVTRNKGESSIWTSRYLWLFLFFILIFAGVTQIVSSIISAAFDLPDTELNTVQQLQIISGVVIVFMVVIIAWIYVLPMYFDRREENMKNFDVVVLDIVINKIEALNDELTQSDVKRCWSCFEVLENEESCQNCGKKQL